MFLLFEGRVESGLDGDNSEKEESSWRQEY